jgi:hypothetical protein
MILLQDFFCAQNRNRTCTPFRELVPETSASTNSATWAFLFVAAKIMVIFCFVQKRHIILARLNQ